MRLPTSVRPVSYQIALSGFDFTGFTFVGDCSVTLETDANDVKAVLLHASELSISHVTLNGVDCGPTRYDEKDELLAVHLPKVLENCDVLRIIYTGILNDKLRGLYRSKAKYDGRDYHFISTHFEATGARFCFPCFDEPSFKATFQFSITAARELTVLSCMNEVQTNSKGLKEVEHIFAPTPCMSSYITALAVGHFDHISGTTGRGTPIRIFTPPGSSHLGEFALKVASGSIDFYEKFFDIPYQLPKLDLIAIADFPIGAMENWGLVTFREGGLLRGESTSFTDLLYIALVVAHELAHMWFGNLVTMRWWSDLWLKEGFATFMEYVAVASIFPHWDVWTLFVTREQRSALDLDTLASSHPIEVPVQTPSQIDEIFDIISYQKGCSLIYMLRTFLGNDVFRDGLRIYLNKFAYGNAETADLWAALAEVSGEDVAGIMSGFTQRAGYPLLNVTPTQVTQEPMAKCMGDSPWLVPLRYSTADGAVTAAVVGGDGLTTKSEMCQVNTGSAAFARINYSDEQLRCLAARMCSLLPVERIALQNDAFALVRSGRRRAPVYMSLLCDYTKEDNLYVVRDIATNMASIGALAGAIGCKAELKRWQLQWTHSVVANLGETTDTLCRCCDDEQRSALHGTLLSLLISADCPKTTSALRGKDYATLPADHQPAALAARASVATEIAWLTDAFATETLQDGRLKLLRTFKHLPATQLAAALAFTQSSAVRVQDAISAFISIAWSSDEGYDLIWKFIQSDWLSLKRRYGNSTMLGRLVRASLSGSYSSKQADEVEQFFKQLTDHGIDMALRQTLEQIRRNATWLAADGAALKEFLAK